MGCMKQGHINRSQPDRPTQRDRSACTVRPPLSRPAGAHTPGSMALLERGITVKTAWPPTPITAEFEPESEPEEPMMMVVEHARAAADAAARAAAAAHECMNAQPAGLSAIKALHAERSERERLVAALDAANGLAQQSDAQRRS